MGVGQHPQADPLNPPKANVGHIWKTFFIICGITAAEFLIAFTVDAKSAKIIIFILMTIAKAYFIVSEFMHLGHEKKALVYAVILPFVFVLWMIGAFIWDGTHYFDSYFNYWVNR